MTSAPKTEDGRPLEARRTSRPPAAIRPAARFVESLETETCGMEIGTLAREAFRQVHRGYSVDFILANPEMDAEFVDQCRKLGLMQSAAQLNAELLRLRKSGSLDVPTTKKAVIDAERLDEFVFASEIAVATLQREGFTFDQILCEPTLGEQFDEMASTWAPGYSEFEYRWAALAIRKSYEKRKAAISRLSRDVKRRRGKDPINLDELDFGSIPAAPGVYRVFERSSRELYIGESDNLSNRLSRQFADLSMTIRCTDKFASCEVSLYPSVTGCDRTGLRLYLVKKFDPIWNYRTIGELAAVRSGMSVA